jgi:hypothetical protein
MRNWVIIQELLEASFLKKSLIVSFSYDDDRHKVKTIYYIQCAKNIYPRDGDFNLLRNWLPKTSYSELEIETHISFLYDIKAIKDEVEICSTRDEGDLYHRGYSEDDYWEDEKINGLFHYEITTTRITWLGANLLDILNYFQKKENL